MARPSLFAHRKFFHLAALLGAPYRAIGVLEMIWRLGYESGDPNVGPPSAVEIAVGWDGEPGACASALVTAGFVDVKENGDLAIHDLEHHAPEYVKARERKERQRRRERDATVTVTGRDRDCHPTPTPTPTPTSPNGDAKAPRPRFTPPTIEEVREYCRERRNTVDPEAWVAHYEANGWRVGRNAMKDWKAAVRTWERNGFGSGPARPPERNFDAEVAEILRRQEGRGHAA